MPKKTHGLGRGLDVLLPEVELLTSAVQEIPVGNLDPNPDQPRQTFSAESITELAQSIREQGVLQPLLVTQSGSGRFRIVAGERRWRAAREAGLQAVPCLVKELERAEELEIALIENLQREDLNPVESAQGLRVLMEQFGYTQEQAARRIGKSRPAVANSLRLLKLPDEVLDLVRSGELSAGHARVLAGIPDSGRQVTLAKRCVDSGLSVRELEKLAQALRGEGKPAPARKKTALSAELRQVENRFRERLGVRATVTGNEKKGRIVLQYYSREELERVWDALERLGD